MRNNYRQGDVPGTRKMKPTEIQKDCEANTGEVIVETFEKLKPDPAQRPAATATGGGDRSSGAKGVADALRNASVLEFAARPAREPMPPVLPGKHFLRNHGPGAYHCQKQIHNQRTTMNKPNPLITVMSLGLLAAGLTGCDTMSNTPKGTITKADFGATPEGTPVELYTLRNSQGMEAQIMTYGGIVRSLRTPDKNGTFDDVVLGFTNLDGYVNPDYVKHCPYFGALIGRYGNRIAHGQFSLEGAAYQLATNNGVNALHGGLRGFDKVVWTARPLPTAQGPALILTHVSQNGEEGYPGTLAVTAIYSLTEDNALRLDFTATTAQHTIVNLTQHSYFNLRGSGDILGHIVQINADQFTPVDSGLIPTGELRPVAGTPFDFRTPTAIGLHVNDTNDEQIRFAGGYDDNWVLNKQDSELSLAARVHEPVSGRTMEVWTTAPGLQFYTGNFLDGSFTGKDGWTYQYRNGLCLEPQYFPDSPNHPNFPTTELKPGETYHNTIIYKFGAQ